VTHQKRQIKKLEVESTMPYQLVMGLTGNSQSMVSLPKLSIGYAPVIVKEEETIQQDLGDLEMEQVD
jgi:hypothetical protein